MRYEVQINPDAPKVKYIYYKPCYWIFRDNKGGMAFSYGTNTVHEGESWLWYKVNRIKNKLFHRAIKRWDLRICRWYVRTFHKKEEIFP